MSGGENYLMNAAPCPGVCVGTCVMLEDDNIVYAGPLETTPNSAGKLVLMNAEDFEKLKVLVDKRKH